MDVLRRVRALRRRPEKLVEDSLLTSDCGALHLHHPGWYGGLHEADHLNRKLLLGGGRPGQQQRGGGHYLPPHVNLLSYEDLHSLSSVDADELGLSFFRSATPSSQRSSSPPLRNHKTRLLDRLALPQIRVLRGQTVSGPRPSPSVLLSDIKLNLRRKCASNEVFRSNSFRFEKYERDEEEEEASNMAKNIRQKVGRRRR